MLINNSVYTCILTETKITQDLLILSDQNYFVWNFPKIIQHNQSVQIGTKFWKENMVVLKPWNGGLSRTFFEYRDDFGTKNGN